MAHNKKNENIKIVEGNLTYYINESKKTVVAVYQLPHGEDILDELTAPIPFENYYNVVYDLFGMNKVILMGSVDGLNRHPNDSCSKFFTQVREEGGKFIGKAKCSPSDIFNIETGKRIAHIKALKKYWHTRYKLINQIDDLAMNFSMAIGEALAHAEKMEEICDEITMRNIVRQEYPKLPNILLKPVNKTEEVKNTYGI